ncbi:hypothetical protein [Amycolatopsis kentuckyensis]|uniref:hypothetical protein n=1 Tax=Amycolatopsis kentuckyensis TaxID=218823 RepID=UPI0035649E5C
MKKLKGWDAYVAETEATDEDRSIELPLTDDEVYIIRYPTREQGKAIEAAEKDGDADALCVALLGEEAGRRVAELSRGHSHHVLDAFLMDVMRKFGFLPEEETEAATGKEGAAPVQRTTRKRSTPRANSSAA